MATKLSRGLFDELLAEGWPRVERLVSDGGEEESVRLDFKEVRPSAVPSREDYIREKFAKAVSGFANTDGGVLIYGIKTNGAPKGTLDRAQQIVEIENVAVFRADLDKLAARVVEPLVAAIEIQEIEKPGAGGHGVVAVYVPKSARGPHRVVDTKIRGVDDHYYGRVATEFDVIPHSWLGALFAYSSPPRLEVRARFCAFEPPRMPSVELRLRNTGRGAARRPAVMLFGPPHLEISPDASYQGWVARFRDTEDGRVYVLIESVDDRILYGGAETVLLVARCKSEAYSGAGQTTVDLDVHIMSMESERIEGRGRLQTRVGEKHSDSMQQRLTIGGEA